MTSPILAEIRAIREAYAARYDYNVRRIVEDARRRDAEDDRLVVAPPRRPTPTAAHAVEAATK